MDSGVDSRRLLECLAVEVARVREVAARDLAAPVPTCPGWTVRTLVHHLANAYLNVVVRRMRGPDTVPEQDLGGQAPLAALDRGYAEMLAEFTSRDPRAAVGRESYETVYFWIRRMAHETVIHRLDVELALGEPAGPIPADLAIDGVDEMLGVFLGDVTRAYPDEFAAHLTDWADRWVRLSAGGVAWAVTVRPAGAEVSRDPTGTASASVRAEPAALARWLYNRGGDEQVTVHGDAELIGRLRRLLTAVTNTG